MSRRISRITCSIVSVVIVAASASSCVANDGSILIIGILAPPTSSGTGATAVCTYTADIMGPFLSFGTVDFAFTRQYIPELLLGNQLVPQANGSIDRLETDNINIEGAIVTVTDEGTGEQLDEANADGARCPTAAASAIAPRVTPGDGNVEESATENKPPLL